MVVINNGIGKRSPFALFGWRVTSRRLRDVTKCSYRSPVSTARPFVSTSRLIFKPSVRCSLYFRDTNPSRRDLFLTNLRVRNALHIARSLKPYVIRAPGRWANCLSLGLQSSLPWRIWMDRNPQFLTPMTSILRWYITSRPPWREFWKVMS